MSRGRAANFQCRAAFAGASSGSGGLLRPRRGWRSRRSASGRDRCRRSGVSRTAGIADRRLVADRAGHRTRLRTAGQPLALALQLEMPSGVQPARPSRPGRRGTPPQCLLDLAPVLLGHRREIDDDLAAEPAAAAAARGSARAAAMFAFSPAAGEVSPPVLTSTATSARVGSTDTRRRRPAAPSAAAARRSSRRRRDAAKRAVALVDRVRRRPVAPGQFVRARAVQQQLRRGRSHRRGRSRRVRRGARPRRGPRSSPASAAAERRIRPAPLGQVAPRRQVRQAPPASSSSRIARETLRPGAPGVTMAIAALEQQPRRHRHGLARLGMARHLHQQRLAGGDAARLAQEGVPLGQAQRSCRPAPSSAGRPRRERSRPAPARRRAPSTSRSSSRPSIDQRRRLAAADPRRGRSCGPSCRAPVQTRMPAAARSAAVSASGRPTTAVKEPLIHGMKAPAGPWMA